MLHVMEVCDVFGSQDTKLKECMMVEHVIWMCIVGISTEVLDGVLGRCPATVLRGMVC